MERRFCSSGLVGLFSMSLGLAVLAAPALGCTSNGAVAPALGEGAAGAEALLKQAREFSQAGESHRAEQYFLAALEIGASPDDVYPELIDTCIRGGRLGSASVHVDKRLRERPTDIKLLRLSISLEEGLGHEQKANQRAQQLASTGGLSPEEELFLSGYFERSGQTTRALELLRFYMANSRENERPPWVEGALARLENEVRGSAHLTAASLDAEVGHE